MIDPKIKYLTEILGVNEDFHWDYYESTTKMFMEGMSFPLQLRLDGINEENIISSWFETYAQQIQLVSSFRSLRTIEHYPGKLQIWEDDLVNFSLRLGRKVVWEGQFTLKKFPNNFLDRLTKLAHGDQQEHSQVFSNGKNYVLEVQVLEKGFERKFNENVYGTADMKINIELSKLKQQIEYAHADSISHLTSSEQDYLGQLNRIIHRLELWGYNFSHHDYYKPLFTDLIREEVVLTPLHFRHTWAIHLMGQLLLDPMDNIQLIKTIEDRVRDEEIRIKERFAFLQTLKM